MKTKSYLLVTIAVLVNCHLFAQATTDSQQPSFGLYIWNTNVPLKECSRDGIVISVTPVDAEPYQKFRVIDFKGDTAIVQILNYTKMKDSVVEISNPIKFLKYNYNKDVSAFNALRTIDKKSGNLEGQQRYFLVPKSYIVSSASKWYGRNVDISVGVLTLPLKLRLKDGDFTGSFTIGGTGGIKLRASHYKDRYHNFLLGLGISNITLDSNTVSKNKDKIVSNLTALTGSLGYLYQSGKIQAGIFIGVDYLTHSNQERFDWRYQGKPWVSLAVGISIFGDGSDKKSDSTAQSQGN